MRHLPCSRPNRNGASWPRAEPSETGNQNEPFLALVACFRTLSDHQNVPHTNWGQVWAVKSQQKPLLKSQEVLQTEGRSRSRAEGSWGVEGQVSMGKVLGSVLGVVEGEGESSQWVVGKGESPLSESLPDFHFLDVSATTEWASDQETNSLIAALKLFRKTCYLWHCFFPPRVWMSFVLCSWGHGVC